MVLSANQITIIFMGGISLALGIVGYLISPIGGICDIIGSSMEFVCVLGLGMTFASVVIVWMGLNNPPVQEQPITLSTNDMVRNR